MFCFAADTERLPDCDDAALNFPINIRRASVFQTGPLSEDELSPFFPLSPSEHRRLPFDNSIGKQAKQSCPLTESGAEWHSGLWAADKRAGRTRLSHNFSNNQCRSVLLLNKKKQKHNPLSIFGSKRDLLHKKQQQWNCSSGSLCCYKIIKSWSISEYSFCFCSVQLRRYEHKHGDNTELTLAFAANTAPLGAAFIAAQCQTPSCRSETGLRKAGNFIYATEKDLMGTRGRAAFCTVSLLQIQFALL